MHAVRQSQRVHQQRRLRLQRSPRSAACGRLPAPVAAPAYCHQLQHRQDHVLGLAYIAVHTVLLTTILDTQNKPASDTYSKIKQCGRSTPIPPMQLQSEA